MKTAPRTNLTPVTLDSSMNANNENRARDTDDFVESAPNIVLIMELGNLRKGMKFGEIVRSWGN